MCNGSSESFLLALSQLFEIIMILAPPLPCYNGENADFLTA